MSVGRAHTRRAHTGSARTRRAHTRGPAALRWRRGALALPRIRLRLPGPRFRLAAAIVLGIALVLGGGWLWVRDSSLVAVERVSVTGESGPDAAAIRSALTSAARTMTTLDVQMAHLRTAVSPFPEVKDLRVVTEFPHGMRIRVIEQLPVAVVDVGGRRLEVAGDGTILHAVSPDRALPLIPLSVPPGGTRLSEPDATAAVAVLAAAPYQMLAKVSQVTTVRGHGLVAQLRGGPSIYFGDTTDLPAKWMAAAEVLADPGSVGAFYIDVTDPARPAAGAQTPTASTTGAQTPTATTMGAQMPTTASTAAASGTSGG